MTLIGASLTGAEMRQKMLDAGTSQTEVNQWEQESRTSQMKAGMSPEAMDKYWKTTPPDMTAAVDAVHDSSPPMDLGETTGAFTQGFHDTAIGRLAGHALGMTAPPTEIPPGHEDMANTFANAAGHFLGDLPLTVAGFVAGGAAGAAAGTAAAPGMGTTLGGLMGAGAGAAALPAAVRQVLMDHYAGAGPYTWGGFWTETGKALMAAGKNAAIGGPAALVGGGVGSGLVAAGVQRGAALTADVVSQALTATAIGAGLDGKVPDASGVAAGVVLALGFHTAGTAIGATGRFQYSTIGEQAATNLPTKRSMPRAT